MLNTTTNCNPRDIARLYGGDRGWLAVLEEKEESACLQNYILTAWEPSFKRYAIGLRAPFTMPGIYHWFYPNGSLGRDTKKNREVVEFLFNFLKSTSSPEKVFCTSVHLP